MIIAVILLLFPCGGEVMFLDVADKVKLIGIYTIKVR